MHCIQVELQFLDHYQITMKSKNIQILIHAPHVSLDVPKAFYKGLIINKNLFHKYNLEMADIEKELEILNI